MIQKADRERKSGQKCSVLREKYTRKFFVYINFELVCIAISFNMAVEHPDTEFDNQQLWAFEYFMKMYNEEDKSAWILNENLVLFAGLFYK